MPKGVTVELVKVPSGYRLNGFPLADGWATPEGQAHIERCAKALADKIDADALTYAERMWRERDASNK